MNIYTWIFTGLLLVDIFLYIFSLIKGINPLEKVARSLLIPLVAGIILSILTGYLPDSHHIIFIAILAYGTACLFMLTTLKKNRFFKFAEHFLFLLTNIFWLLLISSVYRIYKVSPLLFILTGIVFIAGFVVTCVFIKQQPLYKYAAAIIQYFFTAVLSVTAFVCLLYEKRAFAVLIFTASLVIMCHVIFETFQRTRPFAINEKTERIFTTILSVTAQALIGVGAILMQI